MADQRDFHHPYQPYDIQLDFMNAVYDCIKQKKVGIFESPTGTGKSLSLICGSLTWLREYEIQALNIEGNAESDDEPEWVIQHAKNTKRTEFLDKKKRFEARLQKVRDKEAQQRKRYENGEAPSKRQKVIGYATQPMQDDEAEFVLDDYESDQESESSVRASNTDTGMSNKTHELAVRLGLASAEAKSEDDEPDEHVKIFFCSRTHSQLTQFAHELKRVKIPFMDLAETPTSNSTIEQVKHLSLGSRKNLCINKDVRRLGSATAINEKCLDMQQSKTSGKKCSFLPNKENETLVHQFRDHALAKIRDIEDLSELGEKIGICPYYASRSTIQSSEIVTLPYPLLLQKSAREALDLSLKDHVVIIDEAHNLMDAIAGIYSVQITLSQLEKARSQLTVYLQKFRTRLKGKNRVYVAQIVRLVDSLVSYLQSLSASSSIEGLVKISNLLNGKGVDQINLYKLIKYLQESKLARKVDGYTLFSEQKENKQEISTPVLTLCQSFFQALTYPAVEGRFFYAKDKGEIVLRYLLLDPTNHFKEIVEEARAVILAGGTMSPMDDYRQHLFPYLEPSRLSTLSCGHVIPAGNMTAIPLSKTSTGTALEFTFDKRNSTALLDGLGETILGLISVIPNGVVIFFPSYAYLEQVMSRWKQNSGKSSLFDRLNAKKTVIYEAKSDTAVVDDVLERYSAVINSETDTKGALLLSVVGGKLSEGINFSDKLGRAVFIVGLPFPNVQSAEWKAKLEYIEQQTLSRTNNAVEAKNAARTFYENACMRAVNQCIGRAIRHKGDYAGIFLIDSRYSTNRIQSKLPGWIQQGLVKDAAKMSFEDITGRVKRFFESKAER